MSVYFILFLFLIISGGRDGYNGECRLFDLGNHNLAQFMSSKDDVVIAEITGINYDSLIGKEELRSALQRGFVCSSSKTITKTVTWLLIFVQARPSLR
ncbi:hypothetical protein FN846DRAFT_413636 [Sphaerosporella brunnea]|uniref:Uncharacterized protein n=1 Tax=Sphaerosporella brunnea TaxID=1250544 RepID=A0A5J5F5C4_9PEZI|nr:hypothetical protein FN846DRAFT_413636 [Sphaerosporella brunnea]